MYGTGCRLIWSAASILTRAEISTVMARSWDRSHCGQLSAVWQLALGITLFSVQYVCIAITRLIHSSVGILGLCKSSDSAVDVDMWCHLTISAFIPGLLPF